MYLNISAMNESFNPKVGLRALFSGPHWLAPYLLALASMWDRERRCSRSCMATPAPRHSQTCHVCHKCASGTQTKASCIPWPSQTLGAANSSTRMCLSLDGPALPLILPRDLLLMRHFLHLPGRRWKSGHPGCRQDGASRWNRSYRRKCYPPHICCGR
jgi:hypothetical protein